MMLLISPSKTQNFTGYSIEDYTLPVFLPEIETLIEHLKVIDKKGLSTLMNLSDKLSDLNWDRFQRFSSSFDLATNARQAILAFRGGVYSGIEAAEFSLDDLEFAQKHLRIISGLYGLLRPLDLIQPYRLEMKTKLRTASANNLYEFWDNKITDFLNQDLAKAGNTNLVNLASQEYFKAVRAKHIQVPILDIVFKVRKNNQYKVIAIHAKKARGLMVNFVIKNRLDDIEDLKKFRATGYCFKESLSSELQWVFCKE